MLGKPRTARVGRSVRRSTVAAPLVSVIRVRRPGRVLALSPRRPAAFYGATVTPTVRGVGFALVRARTWNELVDVLWVRGKYFVRKSADGDARLGRRHGDRLAPARPRGVAAGEVSQRQVRGRRAARLAR